MTDLVPTEYVEACALCGNHRRKLFARTTHLGLQLTYVACAACGLIFQSPRMNEEQNRSFYEKQYRLLYTLQREPTAHELDVQLMRARHLIDFAQKNGLYPTHVVEIGSSAGKLLQEVMSTWHPRVEGIELDAAYREFTLNQGLIVYPDLEAWQESVQSSPDLIVMSHVLEHLPDPVAFLKYLRNHIISSNGFLLLEVPNVFVHESFELAHMYAFSATTLKGILRRASFQPVAVLKHGMPFRRSELYITVLSQPTTPALPQTYSGSYLRVAQLRRILGRTSLRTERTMTRFAAVATRLWTATRDTVRRFHD